MSVYDPDTMHVVKGFTVELSGACTGGSGNDVDSAWETCTGGTLNIEVCDSSVGSDQFHTTTPGHKYIDVINLRGPMTAARKALCKWIMDTVKGSPWKSNCTVKEIKHDGTAGKSFVYVDCFPTRYVFPHLSAAGTGNLYEEVEIKPTRMEIQG